MRFCTLATLLFAACPPFIHALFLDSAHLPGDYKRVSGRATACPTTLSYPSISTKDGQVMEAGSMSADGQRCSGKGGKVILHQDSILNKGLRLPNFVQKVDISFFAGVESRTRICGSWAFNASTISWFIFNGRAKAFKEKETGVMLEPGYVYLAYEHFIEICTYRRKVEGFEIGTDSSKPHSPSGREPDASQEKPSENDDVEIGNSIAESTTPEISSGSVCFPGTATVRLEDENYKRMDELQIGDRVLSSIDGAYSDVYLFSHHDSDATHWFVKFTTEAKRTLLVTDGHFVFVNGVMTMASEAKVGDWLTGEDGSRDKIVEVGRVLGKGLYNPQTVEGEIVVDGILVTTWTSRVAPTTASALLSPLKLAYKLLQRGSFTGVSRCLLHFIDLVRTSNLPILYP